MDSKSLLAKSITLLYRESQLKEKIENSTDLVRTVLENIHVSEVGIGLNTDREVMLALKAMVIEMCDHSIDHEYDKNELLHRIKLVTLNDDKLYEAIKQGLIDDLDESIIKRTITNIKKSISNHFKEQQISDILNKASSSFKYHREKIKDIDKFITDLITQLEPLQIKTVSKDIAVIGEIDIGNEESLRGIFKNIVDMNSGDRLYKTGWPALNRMLQGGFRPGETWVYNALQHNYKTGFSLSLFAQTALFNTPLNKDTNKKPLLLRISFEDDLVNNLQFLYQYLKYSETREQVYVKDIPVDEMTQFVKQKLQATGFHIKMLRVDPNQWTYKHICNKIIELEAQGYVVEVLDLDYLYKVPTVGCSMGPTGSDILDMFSRLRNFCSSKAIVLRTPHQLSTEAKSLLRGGLPAEGFVKELAGKGYFEGTKGLDRIYDGGLILHLVKHNKKTYLSCQLDKHRFPTVANEEDKYFLLEFPKYMPLPHDINGEDLSKTKLSGFENKDNHSIDNIFGI